MAVFKSQHDSTLSTYNLQLNSGHIRDIYQYLNRILYNLAARHLALQKPYHSHSHFTSKEKIYVYDCAKKDWIRNDADHSPLYFQVIQIPSADSNEIQLSDDNLEILHSYSANHSYYFYVSSTDPDNHTPVDTFCARPVAAPAPRYAAPAPRYAAPAPRYATPAPRYAAAASATPSYINYVISAHGQPTMCSFSLPPPILLGYFTKDGKVLSCPNQFQTSVCSDAERNKLVEIISAPNHTRDYLLSKDESKDWKSGVVDCLTKRVIFNLQTYNVASQVPLSHVITQIHNYHISTYGAHITALVNCLFCRGGEETVYLECSWPRR
jgi:hypothetical protein